MLFLACFQSRIFNDLMSRACCLLRSSQVPSTLFLHTVLNIAHSRLVNTFEYTGMCTQGKVTVTQVYPTPPITVTRSQYKTVARWCFSSMRFYTIKDRSPSFWTVRYLGTSQQRCLCLLPIIWQSYPRTAINITQVRRPLSNVDKTDNAWTIWIFHSHNRYISKFPLALAVIDYSAYFLQCHFSDD